MPDEAILQDGDLQETVGAGDAGAAADVASTTTGQADGADDPQVLKREAELLRERAEKAERLLENSLAAPREPKKAEGASGGKFADKIPENWDGLIPAGITPRQFFRGAVDDAKLELREEFQGQKAENDAHGQFKVKHPELAHIGVATLLGVARDVVGELGYQPSDAKLMDLVADKLKPLAKETTPATQQAKTGEPARPASRPPAKAAPGAAAKSNEPPRALTDSERFNLMFKKTGT